MTKYWTVLATASLVTLLVPAVVARADIFQWEYVNPADLSQGRQPSTTLAPDGAGANVGPPVNLSNRNLTKAYLAGAPLYDLWLYDGYSYNYYSTDLSGTNLSQADLTGANLSGATLTGTNLTNAYVRGGASGSFGDYHVPAHIHR